MHLAWGPKIACWVWVRLGLPVSFLEQALSTIVMFGPRMQTYHVSSLTPQVWGNPSPWGYWRRGQYFYCKAPSQRAFCYGYKCPWYCWDLSVNCMQNHGVVMLVTSLPPKALFWKFTLWKVSSLNLDFTFSIVKYPHFPRHRYNATRNRTSNLLVTNLTLYNWAIKAPDYFICVV